MTTLHYVKKARKPIRSAKIKKGEPYYWWKFAYGSKQVSKSRPRRSQLTRSAFYGTMLDCEDNLNDAVGAFQAESEDDLSILADALDSIAGDIESLGEECQSNKDNMPESLQESDTGQLLETRAEQCETIKDEIESVAEDLRNIDTEEKGWREEAISIAESINWEYD